MTSGNSQRHSIETLLLDLYYSAMIYQWICNFNATTSFGRSCSSLTHGMGRFALYQHVMTSRRVATLNRRFPFITYSDGERNSHLSLFAVTSTTTCRRCLLPFFAYFIRRLVPNDPPFDMPPRKKARTDASTSVPAGSGRITRSRAKALKEQAGATTTEQHRAAERPLEVQRQPEVAVEVRIKPQVRTLPLSVIEDLALDVLIEIFVQLHPRDLLSLARTSKAFRAFLMNRRSTPVWQTVRRQVSEKIPECPLELSEPKYAVLLFTSECMHCGQAGVEEAYWKILARYCSVCEKTEIVTEQDIVGLLSDIEDVYQDEEGPVLTLVKDEWRYFPCLEGIQYYHRREVAQLELLLRSRKRQKLTKRQAIEYAIGAVQKRAKFVRELLEWALRQEAERMREIAHMRSVRASQVKERLVQLGWAEDLSI
ncbi:hypothetical protein C8Q70DRAFT_707556 [Cubamyces menziesii]|nr:hypothetical protein C8Q70DRAFT_707556 [Cubamyces menziesii]